MTDKVIHLDCDCHSPEHIIRYSLWAWDYNDRPEMFVEVQAGHYLPWYKRIWPAIKYMFGIPGLDWHEAIIRPQDVDKLTSMLEEYKVSYDEYEKGLTNGK